MKIVCRLLVLLLPVFAGCTAFENQCNEFTEVDDQLACLDTAFLSLESELVRTRGERTGERGGEREAADLREYLEYCDDLRERASDDEWREQNEDDFEERLRECMAVWERLGDARERQECERDEEAWGKEDLRPAYVEVRLDVDTTEESREEACPRGELGELRTIRDRTRGASPLGRCGGVASTCCRGIAWPYAVSQRTRTSRTLRFESPCPECISSRCRSSTSG